MTLQQQPKYYQEVSDNAPHLQMKKFLIIKILHNCNKIVLHRWQEAWRCLIFLDKTTAFTKEGTTLMHSNLTKSHISRLKCNKHVCQNRDKGFINNRFIALK